MLILQSINYFFKFMGIFHFKKYLKYKILFKRMINHYILLLS